MDWLLRFFRSSVGAKVLMAASGAGLVGFVITHMAGNLQIYLGPEAYNSYAHAMTKNAFFLWTLRLGMIALVFTHVGSGLRLAALNRAARPNQYASQTPVDSTIYGRSMKLTGLVILAFLVYHLLHFTMGVVEPEFYKGNYVWLSPKGELPDAYRMFISGFEVPLIAGFYIVANLLLYAHLRHGVWSIFQSIGLRTPKWAPLFGRIATGVAALVVLGNISMPIAVQAGLIGHHGAQHADLAQASSPQP